MRTEQRVELARLIAEVPDLLAVDAHRFAKNLGPRLRAFRDDVVLGEPRDGQILIARYVPKIFRTNPAAVARQIGAAAAHGVEHDGHGRGATKRGIGLRLELIRQRAKVDPRRRAGQARDTLVRGKRHQALRNAGRARFPRKRLAGKRACQQDGEAETS